MRSKHMNSKPDGYTPEGVPVYLVHGRGNGKSKLQLEIYRKLCGITDKKWERIKREIEERDKENGGCEEM